MLAERGIVGTLLLLAAGLACALIAARRIIQAPSLNVALDGVVALATLVAVAVTGMFDAVLLLAAPTFYLWTIVGVTLPRTVPVRTWSPPPSVRRAVKGAVLAMLLAFTVDAAGGVAAIRISGDGRQRGDVERALRYDPGNHRLHLLLSRRGRCSQRIPHARAARELLPEHLAPRQALRACGEPED
jgi:hypothetical protein